MFAIQLTTIDNLNPKPSRITSLGLANEHEQALLLVGSDDGIVRLWSHCHNPAETQLRTGFNALSGLECGKRGPGLVVHWRQTDGLLVAAGDVSTIRVWDLNHELAREDISISSSVTCMAAVPTMPAIVAVGLVDGGIQFFDLRVPLRFASTCMHAFHLL